jgi:hypothetical protein
LVASSGSASVPDLALYWPTPCASWRSYSAWS